MLRRCPGASAPSFDLHSGEVYDEILTDPMMVGADAAIDVDEDPARWSRFDRSGSQDGRQDMNAFAADRRWGRARAFLADEGTRAG